MKHNYEHGTDADYYNDEPDPEYDEPDTKNTVEVICSNCNGSGEGQYDGSLCYICHGKGTVLIEIEDPEEEPEEINHDS